MPSTHTAREAFAVLTSAGVSGVPVVDIAGAIVANFSVSDVRHLARITNQADTETALALPVLDYLARYVSVGMYCFWCTRGALCFGKRLITARMVVGCCWDPASGAQLHQV